MSALSPTSDPSDDTDASVMRAIATRLLTMSQPFTQWGPVRLVVRQIAPEFPAEVPLPEGSHVLGTLVGKRRVIVLFEVDLPLERFDAYYHERLPAAGWSLADVGRPHGGFVHTRPPGPPSVGGLYCRGEAGPGLVVSASAREDGASGRIPASLHLIHYEKPQESPCAPPDPARLGRMGQRMWDTLLPALEAPPGAKQEGGGSSGGGGSGQFSTTATLDVTDMDAAEVGRHYREQLTQDRWTLTDEGVVAPAAWSTWTFTDEQAQHWTALFFALRHPAMPGRYLLTLRADRIE
jgi:hypothetical protein